MIDHVDGSTVMQAEVWKTVASEFCGKVVVQTHLVDDREIMSLDCMTGSIGIYVDGKRKPADHPIGKDEMTTVIKKTLSRKGIL